MGIVLVDVLRAALAFTLTGAALAGVIGGLSFSALVLALFGLPLLELPLERLQLFLVIGPFLGLVPVALLAHAAQRYADIARTAPIAFAIWLVTGAATTAWFALATLLS